MKIKPKLPPPRFYMQKAKESLKQVLKIEMKKIDKEKQQKKILNKISWFPLQFLFFLSIYFSKLHFTVEMQTI